MRPLMTSHLSTGTNNARKPAYCKKGTIPAKPPIQDGLPTTLNAFAAISTLTSGLTADLADVLTLARNDANNGWTGRTYYPHANVLVDVTDPDVAHVATLTLTLLYDEILTRTHEWYYMTDPDDPRWETPTYIHPEPSTNTLFSLRVLA